MITYSIPPDADRSTLLQTQEMWSAIVPMLVLVHAHRSGRALAPAQALLMGMFLLHYTWRSFVYPLLLRGGKPTPVGIWLMACAFCVYNGYLQVCRTFTTALHAQHVCPIIQQGMLPRRLPAFWSSRCTKARMALECGTC
jgi:hypothetical protein